MSETTFDNLPKAVDYLIREIAMIKEHVIRPREHLSDKHRPIGIEEASDIVGKAKSTIYTLVRKGLIPCCKVGKKLYFYEDELLDWIASGRKKNIAETKADIESASIKNIRNKPKNKYIEYTKWIYDVSQVRKCCLIN